MDKYLRNFLLICLCFLPSITLAERPAEMYSSDEMANTEAVETQTESTVQAPLNIPAPPPVQETNDTEPLTNGDVIDTGVANKEIIVLDFPRRGMDMSKVKNELGEPLTRHQAIGNPPITRWDYEDRTVFFEYNHVIHTVAK